MVREARRPGRRIRASGEDVLFSIVVYTLGIILLLIVAYPLVYVVSASFSDPREVVAGNVVLLPKGIQFKAYQTVFASADIGTGYLNTIRYAVVGTIINVVMTTIAAYCLSRPDIVGRNSITFMIAFTMFFSGGMIPTYITIRNLQLLDTFWVMVLPGAISATNMMIMRNHFQHSVPQDIIEAAYMDGCNNVQTLWRVVLPVSKSILAVMTIFYMVGHWNAYFDAMIYLSTRSKYPLQVFLREILIKNQLGDMSDSVGQVEMTLLYETLKYAIIVAATLPMMIIYPFMQRFFVKGIMVGSIKG